jgi:hypothetical protein
LGQALRNTTSGCSNAKLKRPAIRAKIPQSQRAKTKFL